jgi:hypothetical protein
MDHVAQHEPDSSVMQINNKGSNFDSLTISSFALRESIKK